MYVCVHVCMHACVHIHVHRYVRNSFILQPNAILIECDMCTYSTYCECLHISSLQVRVRRIQIMPFFEDYDRVHIGSVTRSQFHRVLSELEIGGEFSTIEVLCVCLL